MTTVATSDNIWATVARDEVAAAARSPPPDCGHYIGSPQPGSASSTPRPGKGDGKAGPLPPAMSLPADWCAASDDDEDEATDAGRRHKAAALATAVLLSCADGAGADDDDNAVVSARSAAKTASARSAAADELSEYAAHDDSRSTATAEHHADPEEEDGVKGWVNHAGLRAEAAAARGTGYHHKATPILVPGPASWEDGDDGSDESAEEDDGDYDYEDEEAPEEDGGDAPFAGGATMKRQYSASFHVTAGGDADGDDAIEEEVEEDEVLSSSPGSAARCRAVAADDEVAEVAEERCELPFDLEAQRQQLEWEKSQALAEYCTRMTAAQVVSENDQRVSLAILMREAHRHHRRAAFKSGAMTGGAAGKPKFPIVGSVARPPFTTDFQWRQIAGNAMEDFELNGHASVQRMLSCMCIFSPASSARDYGDHEDARIGRATRQRQKLIQLQMQAARGGSGLFLEPESF